MHIQVSPFCKSTVAARICAWEIAALINWNDVRNLDMLSETIIRGAGETAVDASWRVDGGDMGLECCVCRETYSISRRRRDSISEFSDLF